ncbi:MAG TPA: 2-oxo acid dehydrogenase subunit E2 [Actinomycetota bacterium]|nr:2-oxo acid dehydrogenase subunit E2 [Actinomycetota bacterium]
MKPQRSKITGWRKITSATWTHPSDPQIYGDLEVDATALLAFLEDTRSATGAPATITHLVGKAVAHALGENPDLNVHMYRGHFVRNDSVDVFFIVSMGGGKELSGVKVERADTKSVVEIATEVKSRAEAIRGDRDVELGKTKKMMSSTPRWLMGPSMRLAAWLTTDLNLDLKRYGLPRQPFGSVMVSSVGMFGIGHAYAPLSPYYRIPFLVLVGEVTDKPAAVDGQVVVRPMLNIAATMDHRYVDGFHAARLARSAREYLEDPKRFEPAS